MIKAVYTWARRRPSVNELITYGDKLNPHRGQVSPRISEIAWQLYGISKKLILRDAKYP